MNIIAQEGLWWAYDCKHHLYKVRSQWSLLAFLAFLKATNSSPRHPRRPMGVAKSVNLHGWFGWFGDIFLLILFYQVNIQPIAVWKITTNADFILLYHTISRLWWISQFNPSKSLFIGGIPIFDGEIHTLDGVMVSRLLPRLACMRRVPGMLELCLPLCFPLSPLSPSLSPRCCLPVASHVFSFVLQLSSASFPDVFSQMWSPHCLPSCFPVVFWMSKRYGLPIVSHCPALVSRFPAVSQMWSPTCHPVVSGCFTDVVFRLSPDGLPVCWCGLPIVFHLSPTTSSLPATSQIRGLPIVSQVFPLAVNLKPSLLLGWKKLGSYT